MLTQEQMFERLLSKFGYPNQLKKFVEELGELTASIMRLMLTNGETAKGFKTSEKEMLYELFDVEFMTKQIIYHYTNSSKETHEFYDTTRKTWQQQQQNKLEQYLNNSDGVVVADRLYPFYPTHVSSQSPLDVGVLGHSVLYQSSTVKQGVQHTQPTIITPNDVDEDEIEALYFHLETVREYLYEFDRAKIPQEHLETYDYIGELLTNLQEETADMYNAATDEDDVEADM